MSKNANDRKRARLHREQDGKCFYCKDPIGILQTEKGFPVLEHYIPQHLRGRHVVLACKRCDKMKAMIPGPQFQEIILRHLICGRKFSSAVCDIAAECKQLNRQLAEAYPPARGYTIRRQTIRNAPVVEPVVIQPLPSQAQAGNSGRDQFISEWSERWKTNQATNLAIVSSDKQD